LTGTVRDISTRRSGELIVYNSIGRSMVGIRTGKILNVYSDSLPPGPEVSRHCSTLGLKATLHLITKNPCLLKTGTSISLITTYADFSILTENRPDILIFTGSRPVLEKIIQPVEKLDAVIVASGTTTGSQLNRMIRSMNSDTVHFAGKGGAFRLKL
jgi:hypothetical protein